MDCITKNRDSAEVLIDYCSGALDATRAGQIEKHIVGCDGCRKIVEAQRELWRTLDGWTAPAVSENFDTRLYARIAQEDSAPAWKRLVRRIFEPAVPVAVWKPAVSLAAVCAVLTAGLMVRTPQPVTHVPQIHVEQSVDMEQVANALDDLELLTPAPSTGSAM
jgi:anti-sigma factor RsiW